MDTKLMPIAVLKAAGYGTCIDLLSSTVSKAKEVDIPATYTWSKLADW